MGMVIELKTIRAKRMQIPQMRNQILMALQYEGEDIRHEYQKTTESWNQVVRFEIMTDITGSQASVLVGTDNKVYRYVDEGTRPHLIRPKNCRVLRFRTGYRAKTKVGHIGSFAGGASGPFVFAHAVHHPGTKARKFSEKIQRDRKPRFTKRMVEAIKLGAERLY